VGLARVSVRCESPAIRPAPGVRGATHAAGRLAMWFARHSTRRAPAGLARPRGSRAPARGDPEVRHPPGREPLFGGAAPYGGSGSGTYRYPFSTPTSGPRPRRVPGSGAVGYLTERCRWASRPVDSASTGLSSRLVQRAFCNEGNDNFPRARHHDRGAAVPRHGFHSRTPGNLPRCLSGAVFATSRHGEHLHTRLARPTTSWTRHRSRRKVPGLYRDQRATVPWMTRRITSSTHSTPKRWAITATGCKRDAHPGGVRLNAARGHRAPVGRELTIVQTSPVMRRWPPRPRAPDRDKPERSRRVTSRCRVHLRSEKVRVDPRQGAYLDAAPNRPPDGWRSIGTGSRHTAGSRQ